MTRKYVAQFSFGPVKRTTQSRTYSHAWACYQTPESKKPFTGFASTEQNAEIQVRRCRNCGWTGGSEIVAVTLLP